MTHSSFVGNGRASGTNCGVLNGDTAGPCDGNFWVAATGPGADPADDACNSGAGSTTTTSPFNTGAIEIRPRPLR